MVKRNRIIPTREDSRDRMAKERFRRPAFFKKTDKFICKSRMDNGYCVTATDNAEHRCVEGCVLYGECSMCMARDCAACRYR